jgi:phosphate transport system substrate-binding protein
MATIIKAVPLVAAFGALAWLPLSAQAQNTTATTRAQITVDAALPDYRRGTEISGKLRSVGSSALTQLLNRWAEDFRRIHPAFELEVIGGGSGTAPPALTEGTAELAPMSRAMSVAERAAFRAKHGYEPTQLTVGLDALAVFVNKNNPTQKISLRELDALYSVTRKRGGNELSTWGALGATGEWADKPIRVFGPQSTQGMYGVFRAEILQGGEYRYDMRTEPVASAIVQGVGADDYAIGFASHSLGSARTRALAVSETPESPAAPPTHATALNATYPLARRLFVYVNRKPGTPLPLIVQEFITYACSKQGQRITIELDGYTLDGAMAKQECVDVLK